MKRIDENRRVGQAKMFRALVFFMLLLIAGVACKKDTESTEKTLTPYNLKTPAGFPKIEIPGNNQPYKERIALGRKLYYDPILSNSGISCSSCHHQEVGFTVNKQSGMPVLHHSNMGWKNTWMWDGRKSGSLEDVMQFEVDDFFGTDLAKLNKHPHYPELFKEAYGVDNIGSRDVARALAQFARVMISSDSKFDQVQRGLAQFTPEEARGFAIFNSEKGSCYHCHTPPLFTDDYLHNIGLDSSYADPANQGYFIVTGDSSDLGRMRTPSLRNADLRSRFMHDGRFSSLKEVVEHYNSGVKRSPSLDPTMIKPGNRTELNLTEQEVNDLVSFLKTLTDSTFIQNPQLSNPD